MSKNTPPTVAIPMLKAYLATLPSYAPIDRRVGTGMVAAVFGTVLFAGIVAAGGRDPSGAFIAASVAGTVAAYLVSRQGRSVRLSFAGTDGYQIVRRFKEAALRHRPETRLPAPILRALEDAAQVRAAIDIRATASLGVDTSALADRLDECMITCLKASHPLLRHDSQSKRDWESMQESPTVCEATLDAITYQVRLMSQELDPSRERLRALNELDLASAEHLRH